MIPELESIKSQILNPFIALLMGLALVYFFFGVIKFMTSTGEESEGKKDGKRHMLWGIVGLAIMVSVYGLLNLVSTTIIELTK